MNDTRTRIKNLLHQDYLHKFVNECVCSKCGRASVPLAFHVVERTLHEAEPETPKVHGFFQAPLAGVGVRRFFPLCTTCAPPCKKCKLPTVTLSTRKFSFLIRAKIGLGVCTEHFHWRHITGGLVARIMKRGNKGQQAEAHKPVPTVANALDSAEAKYFEEVNDCFRTMGDRGDLALYSQIHVDFLAASFEVYKAGFECEVPAKHISGFIAEAADTYKSDPSLGIISLEHIRDRIPQLWQADERRYPRIGKGF